MKVLNRPVQSSFIFRKLFWSSLVIAILFITFPPRMSFAALDCSSENTEDIKIYATKLALGQYDDIIESCSDAINADPKNTSALHKRASAHYGKNDYDLAIADLNSIISLDDSSVLAIPTHSLRGMCFLSKALAGNIMEVDNAIADFSQTLKAFVLLASDLGSKGRSFSDARAEALSGRCCAYQLKHDNATAIVDCDAAISINEKEILPERRNLAYICRADAYFDKGDYDKAVADYGKALELNSINSSLYVLRGNAFYRMNNYGNAIRDFSSFLAVKQDANVYYSRGLAYYSTEEYDKAISDFSEAIKIDPTFNAYYHAQGDAYYLKRDYDKAIIVYRTTVELNPKDDTAWKQLALCYKGKKDYKKALENINKAIEINAEGHTFIEIQAEIFLLSGEAANAGKSYQKALNILLTGISESQKDAEKYGAVSWYALFIPVFSAAESYAKKGIELAPDAHWIRINLGHAYLLQGKKKEAINEYKQFIDGDKKGQAAAVNTIKDDFSKLKLRYQSNLFDWAESNLGMGKDDVQSGKGR